MGARPWAVSALGARRVRVRGGGRARLGRRAAAALCAGRGWVWALRKGPVSGEGGACTGRRAGRGREQEGPGRGLPGLRGLLASGPCREDAWSRPSTTFVSPSPRWSTAHSRESGGQPEAPSPWLRPPPTPLPCLPSTTVPEWPRAGRHLSRRLPLLLGSHPANTSQAPCCHQSFCLTQAPPSESAGCSRRPVSI